MSIRKMARRGVVLAMLAMVLPGQLLAQEVKENCNQEAFNYFAASMGMVIGLSAMAVAAPLTLSALSVGMVAAGTWADKLDEYMECRIEVENIDPVPQP